MAGNPVPPSRYLAGLAADGGCGPRAPDEIENWGSAREWAPKDRPKEARKMPISLRKRPPPPPPRCCFDDHRVRKPAILPSFRREFHFHFPPPPQPPPIPSKEHDLWMHHHHFSSLPLLNYQKKERKRGSVVSEVSAVSCLLATFSSPPYPSSVHPTDVAANGHGHHSQ